MGEEVGWSFIFAFSIEGSVRLAYGSGVTGFKRGVEEYRK